MAYIVVHHKVKDYNQWKPIFDQHESFRRANGCKQTRLFQNPDNPNDLIILLEWDNLDNARRFVQSEDLRKTMEQAGVIDQPHVHFLNEVPLGYSSVLRQ
jgi:quinol monooxygenase YgiN